MVGFSGILGTGYVEDQKMIKGNLIGGKNCEQVWVGSKFDDYSISPSLLRWGYELTENIFFMS